MLCIFVQKRSDLAGIGKDRKAKTSDQFFFNFTHFLSKCWYKCSSCFLIKTNVLSFFVSISSLNLSRLIIQFTRRLGICPNIFWELKTYKKREIDKTLWFFCGQNIILKKCSEKIGKMLIFWRQILNNPTGRDTLKKYLWLLRCNSQCRR